MVRKHLNEKTFKCNKCGQCCRPLVYVSKEDIKRIKRLRFKKEEFVEKEKNRNILKQVKYVCMFLVRENDKFVCSIYDSRPDICRKYPFITGKEGLEDCKPRNCEFWTELKKVVR